jgi:hypothetical protein
MQPIQIGTEDTLSVSTFRLRGSHKPLASEALEVGYCGGGRNVARGQMLQWRKSISNNGITTMKILREQMVQGI